MNEEQLADALAKHLDAMLAGESSAAPLPDEVADLLDLSEELNAITPTPRPEFTAALSQSLLAGQTAATTAGSAVSIKLIVLVVILGAMTAIGILVGVYRFGLPGVEPTGTVMPAATGDAPAGQQQQPALFTPEPAQTLTSRAADSLPAMSPDTPSPTTILDVLPPITTTVEIEATNSFSPPPDLVPGPSGSGHDSGSDSGSGGEQQDKGNHHHDDDDD